MKLGILALGQTNRNCCSWFFNSAFTSPEGTSSIGFSLILKNKSLKITIYNKLFGKSIIIINFPKSWQLIEKWFFEKFDMVFINHNNSPIYALSSFFTILNLLCSKAKVNNKRTGIGSRGVTLHPSQKKS